MKWNTRMTIEDLLKALQTLSLPHPNEAQRTVMLHNGGPLWVIAGPGTGKTQALILRCLHLLCVEKVPPAAILLTTYTRKAAFQLQQRLQETLSKLHSLFPEVGDIDLTAMRLGTIHSLCIDILQNAPGSPYRHIHLLDEIERIFFVMTNSSLCTSGADNDVVNLDLLAWAKNPAKPPDLSFLPSRWERAHIFLQLFERLIEDQVDIQQITASSVNWRSFSDFVHEYQEKLQQRCFTDFTLVQQQMLEWLSSSDGQVFLQGSDQQPGIQHVIVDEYQDTNPLQAALYRAFAARTPHQLCVVGDDDQALYRFRGGTVTCMVRFAEECQRAWPDCWVKPVTLTQTYRSHPEIVRWVNAFVTNQPALRVPGARVANKPQLEAMRSPLIRGPVVYAVRGATGGEVASTFAQLVADLLKKQVIASPAQCALLAYSIGDGVIRPYRNAFSLQGINIARPTLSRDQPVYQLAVGALLFILDPLDKLRPNTKRDPDFGQFLEICRSTCEQNKALSAVARRIYNWLINDSDARHQQPLSYLLEYILKQPTCNQLMEQDPQALEAVQILRDLVEAYDQIVEEGKATIPFDADVRTISEYWSRRFYGVLVRMLYQGIRADSREEEFVVADQAALPVMTIHQSKGLEFPGVAVIVDKQHQTQDAVHQLERAVLPYRRDLLDVDDPLTLLGGDDETRALQDKIRLFYVAYSRARELLFLLTPDSLWNSSPAVGLGGERDWFLRQVHEWPGKSSGRRKMPAPKTPQGDGQLGLWDVY
jgi:DNA helicase II / ATP-dependent DNA helicase PcrA